MTVRSNSFKGTHFETKVQSNGVDKMTRKNSINLRNCEPKKLMLETTLSFKNLVQDLDISEWNDKKTRATVSLPEPSILYSPRPVSELDAAAVKLQKVYKSYRTRRNLADCAVVVEELWYVDLNFFEKIES